MIIITVRIDSSGKVAEEMIHYAQSQLGIELVPKVTQVQGKGSTKTAAVWARLVSQRPQPSSGGGSSR